MTDVPNIQVDIPMDRLMTAAAIVGVAIVAIFLILAVLRILGIRKQEETRASGGLDLDGLKRLREAGEITEEEYNAITGRVTGAVPPPLPRRRVVPPATSGGGGGPSGAPGGQSIIPQDDAGPGPERSDSDGQG